MYFKTEFWETNIKTKDILIAFKSIKFWVESLGWKYASKRKSLLRWSLCPPYYHSPPQVSKKWNECIDLCCLRLGLPAGMSLLLKCLPITNIKIIIIIIIRSFLLNMSKYFLTIFLGTWRSGAYTWADTGCALGQQPLPPALSSSQSLTFPRTGKTGSASYIRYFWTSGAQYIGGGRY